MHDFLGGTWAPAWMVWPLPGTEDTEREPCI